jgi:hypothetical protein
MTQSPMMLIDRETLRGILRMTFGVLRNNFFYGEDQLKSFLQLFSDDFSTALIDFGDNAELHILKNLYHNRSRRFDFTCYFASEVIRDVLIDEFHFNEMELQAFENVMSKHTNMK